MKTDEIEGLSGLWAETTGSERIRIAVLDGSVDLEHVSLKGARLRAPETFPGVAPEPGLMELHGTHVTSLLFGRHDGPVKGVAPGCTGIILPIFRDGAKVPQIDLARAIDFAVAEGAQVVNLSGGQLVEEGEADGWLTDVMDRCREAGVLVVAAAGNDGCDCVHVPAAVGTALAVGALGEDGTPMEYSNYGAVYRRNGILAPGENLLGARPGGGTARMSGTSFAAPVVSGVAALLLSLQERAGDRPDPLLVRKILLDTILPCRPEAGDDCDRLLAGRLNIQGALDAMNEHLEGSGASRHETGPSTVQGAEASDHEHASCGCGGGAAPNDAPRDAERVSADVRQPVGAGASQATAGPEIAALPPSPASSAPPAPATSKAGESGIGPSAAPDADESRLVYALGVLGYDFGTEARRDSFKQLMPPFEAQDTLVPANPYDSRQMVSYLEDNPSEARALIWTLNMELTPLYAIRPAGPYAASIFDELRALLAGEIQGEDTEDFIERVSIPGLLTGESIRLFSGQVVPVLEVPNVRGVYGWRINDLISKAVEAVNETGGDADEGAIRAALEGFLNRVYYDLRNLGMTSHDRALNFAVTNAFQAAATFAEALGQSMELDTVQVERSPFCRQDSDCWDVKLMFFDPENTRRARRVFRFTIDVSDTVPVTLGDVRSWSVSG